MGSTAAAGCTSGIVLLVGVAGVGGNGLSTGGGVAGWGFAAASFIVLALAFEVSVVAMRFFSVPVARTSSMIRLVTGAAALTACAITVGAGAGVGTGAGGGASFFVAAAAAFVVRAGAFFSFSTLTAFSFSFTSATLALALLVAAFFTSTAGVPTSSATTFFGRPRFLAGASTGVVTDMLRAQLMRLAYK